MTEEFAAVIPHCPHPKPYGTAWIGSDWQCPDCGIVLHAVLERQDHGFHQLVVRWRPVT